MKISPFKHLLFLARKESNNQVQFTQLQALTAQQNRYLDVFI